MQFAKNEAVFPCSDASRTEFASEYLIICAMWNNWIDGDYMLSCVVYMSAAGELALSGTDALCESM